MTPFASLDKRFPLLLAGSLLLALLLRALPAPAQDAAPAGQNGLPDTAISAPQESLRSGSGAEPQDGAAGGNGKNFSQPLPPGVEEALASLLTLPGRRGAAPDWAAVEPLLAMAAGPAFEAQALKPAKRENANGVCLRAELEVPLERILRYGYNKDIPNHVIFPSVLRLTGWYPESDIVQQERGLWDQAKGDLPSPVLLWGREYEVNTPDSSTGAYYRYDLDRFLALLRKGEDTYFISVSRMPKTSDEGQKGVPMDDQNWNYFYSGINGLDRGLIGWMDTTLYTSASVQVFRQRGQEPRATCVLFKWLSGGWAGLNVIMPRHIYDGNLRFLKGFKKVMESAALPDSERFAAAMREIQGLSDQALDEKIRLYAHAFENLARNYPNMDKSEFRKIWENGGYSKVLDRSQRIGVLALEYMKAKVGKPVLVDLSSIDRTLAEREGQAKVAALPPTPGGTP